MTAFGIFKYSLLSLGMGGFFFALLDRIFFGRVRTLSRLAIAGFLAGSAVYGYARYVEPNWIEVTRVRIHDPALAAAAGRAKIVHITDIHITGELGYREEELARQVNALEPDLLLFTGDLVDGPKAIEPAIALFNRLKAKTGTFAIPGDTDRIFFESNDLVRKLSDAKVEFLLNRSKKIRLPNGNALWLAGVANPRYDQGMFDRALSGVPAGSPLILMAHSPSVLDLAAKNGVRLVLAGDTHGGQVGIPWLVRMSRYAYRGPHMMGLFRKADTQMYVNRGIGTKMLRIRFLCRPEVAVIELRK